MRAERTVRGIVGQSPSDILEGMASSASQEYRDPGDSDEQKRYGQFARSLTQEQNRGEFDMGQSPEILEETKKTNELLQKNNELLQRQLDADKGNKRGRGGPLVNPHAAAGGA